MLENACKHWFFDFGSFTNSCFWQSEFFEFADEAGKDMRDFCANATEAYRQELLNHNLTPEMREASLKAFIQKVQGVNPTLVALRKADVRRGEAMLNLLAYLEDNWGQWEYRPETKQLRSNDTKFSEGYNRANQEINDAYAEIARLQAEVKKLRN